MRKKHSVIGIVLLISMIINIFPIIKVSAASFTPRYSLSYEDTQSKYWASGTYGVSNGFPRNWNSGYSGGNCTWYAFGRAWELLGTLPNLCTNNAGAWYSYNKSHGYYPYGSTPKLGAIACWDHYDNDTGHVAVVEEIGSDYIVCSESGWSYTNGYFSTKTRSLNDSTLGMGSSYRFLGYIYIIDPGSTPPSNLANIPDGVYSIQHNNSGLYLSAGANNQNGYDTFLYEFGNNGDFGLDQKFYLERLSNNAYKIISQYDNKVIEVDSLSMNDEAHIQKWNYNGVASQQWYIVDRGDGYYKFVNVNSGKAMDIGSYVQQWTDNNTDAQKFKIEAATHTMSANIPNGVYAIQFKKTGLYLSAGANNENGYDTFLYEPGNKELLGEDQKFYLERLSNNAYKIISQYDNKVIEVDNLSYNDQAHIQKWNYNNIASQNWVIIDCGDGYYNFINKHSGKALDMGYYVWQWEYNNTDAQKFKIIPINYTIKYNANGGSGAPVSQTKIYLKDLYLNSITPTRNGYKFTGWNTSSNGKGASYNAGDKYTLNSDVTLYAQWEAIPTIKTTATCANSTIEIQTSISNLSQSASCVAAVYSADGTLLGQTANDVNSSTNSVTAYFPNHSNASYVKVFLWDSLEGMKPLTNGEKINL